MSNQDTIKQLLDERIALNLKYRVDKRDLDKRLRAARARAQRQIDNMPPEDDNTSDVDGA